MPDSNRPASRGSARRCLGRLAALLPAALLTCLVAVYNEFPLTYPDSGNYLENASSILQGRRPWFFFRPLTYGAALAPFVASRTLWLIPLAQGLLAAWVVHLGLRAAAVPVSAAGLGVLFAGLALFTSLPWFTGQLMPDVFTGLVILLCFVAAGDGGRLSRTERWGAFAVLALALAAHLSHLPLYVLLAAATFAGRVALDRRAGRAARAGPLALRLAAPALVAAGFLIASNYYLHREPVLSRSRDLFALAHLVGDSLVQPYLERACPAERYLLCAERSALRADVDWFLWDERGPRKRYEAALERGDSTFLEEASEIVSGTLRQEWPAAAAAALRSTAVQLVTFGLHGGELAFSATVNRALAGLDPTLARSYRASRQVRGALPVGVLNVVQYATVVLSLLLLAAVLPALRGSPVRRLVLTVCLGVTLNALVTASLARVHPRYQSRVVWLVPLAAVAAAMQLRTARHRRADDRPDDQPTAPAGAR